MFELPAVLLTGLISTITFFVCFFLLKKIRELQNYVINRQNHSAEILIRLEEKEKNFNELRNHLLQLLGEQQKSQMEQRAQFDLHQVNAYKMLQESFQNAATDIRRQLHEILNNNMTLITKQMDKLTNETELRLKEISHQVDKRLTDSFEKTTTTFTDIVKRLALIDEAQKRITELSLNVVSLQEILSDKRSRGAFGEIQLNNLIKNILPDNAYQFQFTLSNGKRGDAVLFLPEPIGNIIIDAKFPLESYRRYTEISLSKVERKIAESQFSLDVKKHIQEIHEKYIIPGETADGAMMFLPAEAIFAEIHSRYPELIDFAHASRVWLVSPTTLFAILNTAGAVLKDAATRKQIHIIQEHLSYLSKDFERFQKRIDNLAKYIHLAHQGVEEVHKSSKKLTSRFAKIENVELGDIAESQLIFEGDDLMLQD